MTSQNNIQHILFIAVCILAPLTSGLRVTHTTPIITIRDELAMNLHVFQKQSAKTSFTCNEATSSTKTFVSLEAYHKMGTYLSILGANCLARFYQRHGGTAQVESRSECDCEIFLDSKGMPNADACPDSTGPPSAKLYKGVTEKHVHFTREPFDWLLSNYIYQRRGDETFRHCLVSMREPGNVEKMRTLFPKVQSIPDNVTDYSELLQNVDSESGLAYEMFRNEIGCGGSLRDLIGEKDEGKEPNTKVVCLEDFMKGNEQYLASWHDMLDFIDGSVADNEADECLNQWDISLHPAKHATTNELTATEMSELRSIAQQLDTKYFGSKYTTAAKHIGCEPLHH